MVFTNVLFKRAGSGEQLLSGSMDPCFVFWELVEVLELAEQGGSGIGLQGLEKGVVLKGFGEHFPSDGVDGAAVGAGVNNGGVAISPAGESSAVSDGQPAFARVDVAGRFEGDPKDGG